MAAPALDLPVRPLEGRFVRLVPYAPELKDAVRAALDCDAEAWSLFASSGQGEHFERWWETSLTQMRAGTRIAYAVRRLADGAVVGSTSLLDIRRDHRGCEIGSTFYVPEARAGAVNPDCKRLLLAHAFDGGAVRVELVTDLRNLRSQAAIAKLGAVREGVLRKERITWTGHVRDSVLYSITDEEWPAVRARLEARLETF
jgi:RimJ/RimL family protein N-acetyltransferase